MQDYTFISLIAGLLLLSVSTSHDGHAQEEREAAAPSTEAKKAIQNFQFPDRFEVKAYASEPLLKNPVTFTFDRNGRIYVGETHRWRKGISDNRSHWYWLIDDLASRTTKDRVEKFKKWAEKGKRPMSFYRKYSEKVRRLRDTDGDGVAEKSNLFAGGFDSVLAGPAAGLLFYRDKLYMTCIPYLWKLRDRNNDGTADDRTKLHSGFGVRTSLSGHDMHGLALGPDGRIYFSIGDRGFHVETEDGRQLTNVMDKGGRGAVFRCEPDGSNLEIVHRGLRNPQELAFDQYGNLFSVDNDSDAKDTGRLVYVVEGGDSGWMMPYQYMDRWDAYNSRGPWQEEGLWKKHFDDQPDWIVPPIDHPVGGPSGLVHYPGTGFSDAYDGQFFVCDFHGGANNSGVQRFSVVRDGASFDMNLNERFLWQMAVTDVDFGYDGRMYLSDWVSGWGMPDRGRIYTVTDPEHVNSKAVEQVRKLFQNGFRDRSVDTLASLLSHADQRVRLRSHLALARKKSAKASKALRDVALDKERDVIPRLHGIWGLGVVARRTNRNVLRSLKPLLQSEHDEIRSQVLWVMGEAKYKAAAETIKKQLSHDSLRVRYFAAQALADLGYADALKPVVDMLQTHASDHPYLRHAGVEYLRVQDTKTLLNFVDHPSEEVRTSVVVALRREADPRVARFLNDTALGVVAEAARAIYDMKLMKAMPQLAGLLNETDRFLSQSNQDSNLDRDALLRRAMSANFWLRKANYLRTVGQFAANENVRNQLRQEAIDLLKSWADPEPIDPVNGRYIPYEKIDKKKVANELEELLPKLLTSSSGELQSHVTDLASSYNMEVNEQFFVRTVKDPDRSPASRASALKYLSGKQYENLSALIRRCLKSDSPRLRIKARELLANHRPADAFDELRKALENGTVREKQAAFDTLAELELEKVDKLLSEKLDQLLQGNFQKQIQLDLLQAARKRSSQTVRDKLKTYEKSQSGSDPLAGYRVALYGGNPERGRRIFHTHSAAQCVRCHQVNNTGGKAGPDLSDIGARKDRPYLLKSLVKPGANIARGYQLVTVQLKGGRTVSGTVHSESEDVLSVATAAGNVVRIEKQRIQERSESSGSSMPPMGNLLTKEELRDVVSYLSNLKGEKTDNTK